MLAVSERGCSGIKEETLRLDNLITGHHAINKSNADTNHKIGINLMIHA